MAFLFEYGAGIHASQRPIERQCDAAHGGRRTVTAIERQRIALLPPAVAARIAAGEVIERPASIVKELVENALDAGAGRITVELTAGGIERLRVRDDGCGIPPDELADAFERHATSKLRSEHDLFAVRTLGFRGEALAAIAAAANVDLTTRPAGHDAAAVARMRDGRLAHQGSAAAAPGTTVDVRDLFAALPARLKFLRSVQAEVRAVAQVVADYALAYPDVAFRLDADGRALVQSPGDGDPAAAVAAIHGADVAGRLLPLRGERSAHAEATGEIDYERDGVAPDPADPASVRVHGLIGPPDLHRANRSYIHLFAGGRAIQSRTLTHAIEQAYAGLIPAGRHPVAIVHIDVPPEQVDVNVHPRKAEVRFRHERLVYGALHRAVRDALAGALPPAGAAGAFAPVPAAGDGPADAGTWPQATWPADAPVRGRDVIAGAQPAAMLARDAFAPLAGDHAALAALAALDDPRAQTPPAPAPAPPGRAAPQPAAPPSRLGALRALGQVAATYIVAEGEDGLVLIDQHAAHERVLYERVLAARAAGAPASQPLLTPAVVELGPMQAALAAELADELAAVGWSIEPADGRAVILRAVPAALARREPERALREHLDRLEAEERLTGPDRVAASLACRAAVMAGDRLEETQQRALLRALEATATPQTCPHGRPTMLRFSREALERSFSRR